MASMGKSRDKSQSQEEQKSAREDAVVEKSPSNDEIERRAHEIYVERGGIHGRDLDDWLQAERELKEAMIGPGYSKSLRRSLSGEIEDLRKEDLP
jgi:hypothetical protein